MTIEAARKYLTAKYGFLGDEFESLSEDQILDMATKSMQASRGKNSFDQPVGTEMSQALLWDDVTDTGIPDGMLLDDWDTGK